MPIIRLENLDDPRLAPYSGMTDAQLRDCAHAAHGLFIAESRKVVERALAAGARPVSLFMEERWLGQSMPLVDRLTADDPAFPAFVATREQFHALTGYEVTRGALAAARTSDEVNPERKSSGSQFYIVWGKPFDGATLDRIQQSVTAATNGEIVIPDSLRTIYETTGGTPFLDGQYTVFGRVTEGLEIVEAIQGVATDSAGRPLEDVRIIRAEAVRK